MKRLIAILMILAGVSVAGDEESVIPVSVHAQAEVEVFEAGKPILMSVVLTNGLSKTIRFNTYATEPNEWNGETLNISLIDIYRNKEKRNLYSASPEIKVPLVISGSGSHPLDPNETLRITIDISKWKIQGGWTKGTYELAIRMDNIVVDDKVNMSILSDPVEVTVQ